MSSVSTPSLMSSQDASRSTSPSTPAQPDHFYKNAEDPAPSPNANGWFDPEDDLLATRGIPVFKPTMNEFRDFEGYMKRVECWGMRSGIVKVIPPKEWVDALPSVKAQLSNIKIQTPIEQHMAGSSGHFRVENMEKRKWMSPREWVGLCARDDYRAPGVAEVGLRSGGKQVARRSRRHKSEDDGADESMADLEVEPIDDNHAGGGAKSGKKAPSSRPSRAETAAAKSIRDAQFLETFRPDIDWLPPFTTAEDYTKEFCQNLARQFWRNCGLGKPAWYGADSMGSLFTDETSSWNVAHLDSALSRLLPSSDRGLPGVNTPYLYFGMWRATFAWHVEDMDLFSINYIHFGAPKFWYAIPQGRASAFEQVMRGYFPSDGNSCPQFLRHKQFLVSPQRLAKDSMTPNHCVQHAGEFIITYPRGYHAGFNLGLNCAESVNFALDSWITLGRNAKACKCVPDSVRIDVDQLLRDREEENGMPIYIPEPEPMFVPPSPAKKFPPAQEQSISVTIPARHKKRTYDDFAPPSPSIPKPKRPRTSTNPSTSTPKSPSKPPAPIASSSRSSVSSSAPKIMLKIGARPVQVPEIEHYPCCLCISTSREGLLRVMDPPYGRKDAVEAAGNPVQWLAHRDCADVIPETWVDELDSDLPNGSKESVVFGVDGIVKDRWNLKCAACVRAKPKAHGAPIQCTKGKCLKAYHLSCAKGGHESGIAYEVLATVEKDVVLFDPSIDGDSMQVDASNTSVLKIIRKVEVQVLCPQHNPNVAAAKKASKLERTRKALLRLPPYSPIKIRVSSGVFEVILSRVIEETSSVEVIWDKDPNGNISKREFKLGSVIMGNKESVVLRRSSEVPDNPPLPVTMSSGPGMLVYDVQAPPQVSQTAWNVVGSTSTPPEASTSQSQTKGGTPLTPSTTLQTQSHTVPTFQAHGGGWYSQTHGTGTHAYGYSGAGQHYSYAPPPPNPQAGQYAWQHVYAPQEPPMSAHPPPDPVKKAPGAITVKQYAPPSASLKKGEGGLGGGHYARQQQYMQQFSVPIVAAAPNVCTSPASTSAQTPVEPTIEDLLRNLQTLVKAAPDKVNMFLDEHPEMQDVVRQAVEKMSGISSSMPVAGESSITTPVVESSITTPVVESSITTPAVNEGSGSKPLVGESKSSTPESMIDPALA